MRFTRWNRPELAAIAATVVGLALFAGAGHASAQAGAPVVNAKMVLSTDQVRPGGAAHAAVVAQITTGFHINDHHPSLDYLIPTNLKIETGKIFSVENVSYPRGKIVKFVFSDKGLSVYQGEIVIAAVLKVAAGIAPGEYPLNATLEYQACNDHACLPPSKVLVKMLVKVGSRNAVIHQINSDVFRKIRAG